MKTKVADYIINYLGERGVEDIFVVYGAANGHLVDGFTRTTKTRYVSTMHEQAAGFAAEGYAKIKQVPGVALVTSGPGAQNLVTSIANCFYDSVPCLFLTGQINARFMRSDPTIRQVGFQESDIVGIVTPITKYAKTLTRPEEVKFELERALHIATEGRPGPVLLDIPINVQEAFVDFETVAGFDHDAAHAAYSEEIVTRQIDRYLDELATSEHPVLLIGGGVRGADSVAALAEVMDVLQVPAFVTWNGLDVVKGDSPWYAGRVGTYGGPGRNFGVQNSDLLLAVGCRLSGRITGGNVSSFARAARKYVVDVDPALLQPHLQQVPCDVNILCDLPRFLDLLLQRARTRGVPAKPDWIDRCRDWKCRYDTVKPWMFADDAYRWKGRAYTHPYAFVRDLGAAAPANAVFVGDCGGVSAVVGHALELHGDQRYLTNNGNAPMGFAMAGAMGAWIADPSRPVIVLIGDGGMNMNIQELQTLLNFDIKIKVVILNNHIYGITKAYQETNFEGRTEACGPIGYTPPDFLKVCEAYGVEGFSCARNADRGDAIARLLAADRPVVCDVDSHEYHLYEPRIFGWSTPIEDMFPYLPRDEFKAQMLIDVHETFYEPAYPSAASKLTAIE